MPPMTRFPGSETPVPGRTPPSDSPAFSHSAIRRARHRGRHSDSFAGLSSLGGALIAARRHRRTHLSPTDRETLVWPSSRRGSSVSPSSMVPVFVGRLSTWSGLGIMAGAAILGVGVAVRGDHSAATGALVAGALPLGGGIDWITASVLPSGIFFGDAGLLVGLLLLACGLIRLGRRTPNPGRRMHRFRIGRTSGRVHADAAAGNVS